MFDPATFLNQPVTGALDTKFEPVPEGEYVGLYKLNDPPLVEWKGVKDPTKGGWKLSGRVEINDNPELKAAIGRDSATVRYEIMLDLDGQGHLDMSKGKNVRLGQLREACGCNDASRPFSLAQLDGQPVKARVTQRTYEGEVYNDVKAVTRA